MSAQRVAEAIRAIARDEDSRRMHVALATVTSLHGRNGEKLHACTVQLRESGLVLPRVPLAVGALGFAALPTEGDLVLLAFAGGDLHAPVVIGRIYDDQVAPPVHSPDELVLSLPAGEDDAEKALRVTVTTPPGGSRTLELELAGSSATVSITVDDERIELRAEQASLVLSQSGASDGRAELKVGDSSVVVQQGGDVTVTAANKLTLAGATVEVSGDLSVKVAGQMVEIN